MKKLLLTLGLFLGSILCMQAQVAQTGNDGQVKNMMTKLTQVCKLTPDQVTKVQPFVQQFVQTRTDNKQKFASDETARKAANKTNRETLLTNIKPLLSADQVTEAKSYISEQVKARHNSTSATTPK